MSSRPEQPDDPPQRLLIESRAELASALLGLIGRARRQLRLAAADLSILAPADLAPVAAMREMLLSHSACRIRVLVDDMSWLDARAPRLRNLQLDFPHALLLRCADTQDPVGEDVVAIGDDLDALRLQPTVGIVGEYWRRHGGFAQPLIAEFDRRWEHASHNQAAKPLGL